MKAPKEHPALSLPSLSGRAAAPGPEPQAEAGAGGYQDLSHYIMTDLNRRLSEKEEQLRDQRDQLKIYEAAIRELQERNWELEKDNRFKDKEFELRQAASDLSHGNSLAGVVDKVTANPQVLMLLAGLLTGGRVPAALGSAPEAEEGGPRRQMVAEVTAFFSRLTDEQASKLYALFHYVSQDLGLLEKLLARLTQGNP